MKGKIKKSLPVLVVGIIFAIYILLWYKQFSYFHYSGECYSVADATLNSMANGATERAFPIDESALKRIGRIVFWPTEYCDVVIENNGDRDVTVTVSDYAGREVPAVPAPVRIAGGEEYHFISDDRGDYLLTAYGTQREDAENIQIRYDNHRYMMSWKKCVYLLLGMVTLISIFSALFALVRETFFHQILPWIAFTGGVLTGLAGIALRLFGWENWSYTGLRFLSIYFSTMAVVSAASMATPDTEAEKKTKTIIDVVISVVVALFVHFLFLSARSSSVLWHFTGTLDSNRRIIGYLAVFVIFLLVYMLMESITLPVAFLRYFFGMFQNKISCYAMICSVLMMCDTHNDRNILSLVSVLIVFLGIKYRQKIRIPKAFWILYYGLIVLIVAANHCVINFWDTSYFGDVYHTGTFYHSIYYVSNKLPFAGGLNQMYGHFALFYKIPLVLFGNNMCTIGMTTAVFSGIAVLCLLLFLHKYLREDFSRLLAGIVVFNCFIIDILYLQIFPLRVFWPFVMLLYSSCTGGRRSSVLIRTGGYLLCVLAIVWNMESGLVCAISWAVCVTAKDVKEPKMQCYITRLLLELPIMLAEVFGAYLIVKGYNMLWMAPGERVAEFLDWKKEMATLAREEAGDTSNGKLFWGNAPWLWIEVVLMSEAAIWVHRLIYLKKRLSDKGMPVLFLSVFSAGIFIYWMGRPEGYGIIAPYLGSMLVIALEKILIKERSCSMPQYRSAYMISVFVLSFAIAGYMGHTIEKMQLTKEHLVDKKIADYDLVKEYMQNFAKEVPEKAHGEAYGMAMIYMSLGRDMQIDGLGWGKGVVNLQENARGRKWVLLNEGYYKDIPFLKYEKEIPFGSYSYTLYENTEP